MTETDFLPIANLLPEALLLVTRDGTILAANRAAGRAFRAAPDALRGRPLTERVENAPEQIAELLRLCSRSRDPVPGALTIAGASYRCEGAVLHPRSAAGEAVILLRLVPKESAVSRFVVLNERVERLNAEITYRRRIEQTLDEERQWLHVTLLSIGDAVITTDPQARIRLMNPVAEALTGWTQAEARGRPLDEVFRIVNELTRRPAENPVHQALRDGRVIGLANHTLLIHRDGTERTIDDSAAPIRDEQEEMGGIVLVFRDVTERQRAERELRELNQSLEERVAERTATAEQRARQLRALASELTRVEQRERRRLAVILHDDLQQLIVAAKLHLSLLRSRSAEPQHPDVQVIDDLLQQTIDTSRSLAVELAPPVLYDTGLAAALKWLARWMERHLDLSVAVDGPVQQEPADVQISAFLLQCVRELLFNVHKHSGGRSARIVLSNPSEGLLEIAVEDAGSGFDPTTAREPHQGFGLFSIRERLEMLGGRMQVDSVPRRGTRVSLVCPVAAAAGSRGGEMPPKSSGPVADRRIAADDRRRIRVLLVDDHRILRQGLAALLGGESDIEVVGEAGDADEALDAARGLRPDVVIMDVGLPRVSGIEATRRIVASVPAARVIGLSLHETQDMADAMLAAGAVAYLPKGGPSEALLAAIRAAGPADHLADR